MTIIKSFVTTTVFLAFLASSSTGFAQTDKNELKRHISYLCLNDTARQYKNVERLQDVAAYLYNELSKYADTVYFQAYKFHESVYTNVIAVFHPDGKERIVVGAHYDVCGNQQGADDNASGIAGLLETARQLKGKQITQRMELVAYTLEEPPFFRSELMGSYIHAQSLKEDPVPTIGMICLEMIGFYSEKKHSQHYPIGFLRLIYGSKGNYITLVNRTNDGKFAKHFSKKYKHFAQLPAKKFTASPRLTGIDFSDHLNYWALGIPAVMLTDTSFYRNSNYHRETDTIDTLDFDKMALVVDALVATLINSSQQ